MGEDLADRVVARPVAAALVEAAVVDEVAAEVVAVVLEGSIRRSRMGRCFIREETGRLTRRIFR